MYDKFCVIIYQTRSFIQKCVKKYHFMSLNCKKTFPISTFLSDFLSKFRFNTINETYFAINQPLAQIADNYLHLLIINLSCRIEFLLYFFNNRSIQCCSNLIEPTCTFIVHFSRELDLKLKTLHMPIPLKVCLKRHHIHSSIAELPRRYKTSR